MNADNADMASSADDSVSDVLDSIERQARRGQCWLQRGNDRPVAIRVSNPHSDPESTER